MLSNFWVGEILNLTLGFEKNDGQTDGKGKIFSRGNGYSMFLTPTEAVIILS